MASQKYSCLGVTKRWPAGFAAALLFLKMSFPAAAQTVVAWGVNNQGAIVVPAAATNVTAVAAAGNYCMALRADGSVISWGSITTVPSEATNVTEIAAGLTHSVAIRADGSVVAWGNNAFGQTNVPPEATNVVALAAGNYHNLVLRGDGAIIAWGKNDFGQTTVPSELTNVVAVSAGAEHSLAFTKEGRVVAWGGSSISPLNAATNSFSRTVTDLVAVSAGAYHNLGLRADGRVFLWGDLNTMPATPALATNIVAIAAATNFNIALRADGRLFSWGTGSVTNVANTVTNVISFAAGAGHAIALRGNGAPRLFGSAAYRNISSIGDQLPLVARVGGTSNWISSWSASSGLVAAVTNQQRPQLPTPFDTDPIAYQMVVTNIFGAVTSAVNQVSSRWVNVWGDNLSGQREIPAAVVTPLAVAAGAFHNLALQPDGSVVAWGKNSDGQTDIPSEATNIVRLAGGSLHSLALRSDGSVVAWGRNWDGQTDVPVSATNVISVAAGYAHSLVLRADGSVVAWGNNEFGQGSSSFLAQEVVSIAAGYYHNLALRADGRVVSWGLYDSVPADTTNILAIAAGAAHSLALRADGQVLAWGDNSFGQTNVPPDATNIVAIAAGNYHNLAMRDDGTLLSWGKNAFGNTNAPMSLTNASSLAVGEDHGVVVASVGLPVFGNQVQNVQAGKGGMAVLSVPVRTGWPSSFQWYHDGNLIAGATNDYLVISALNSLDGGNYVLVVTNAFGSGSSAPTVLTVRPETDSVTFVGAWGDNLLGQCDIPTSLTAPRAVAAGAFHNLALQPDGVVVAWGKNSDGQTDVPAEATNIVAIAAGSYHSLALTAMGQVLAWGRNWDGQTNVPPEATNVVAIAAGYAHSLALRADGVALAWGKNDFGQGTVSFLAQNVVAIAAGYHHNLALRADGRVVAWGFDGQVDESVWDDPVPEAATNVIAIAAGWNHSLALRADGTVLAWGDDTFGQSTVPDEATNVVALSAGWYHSVALRADGAILVWGRNAYGIATPPAAVLNVAGLATGEGHALVMLNWGAPSFSSRPQQIAGNAGGQAVLTLPLQTALPASFQWYHNGLLVAGATNRFLVLSGLNLSAGGEYVLAATNAVGGSISPPINLAVNPQPLTITAVGAWGDNLSGQRDIPPSLVNARAIAAGAFHALALQGNGTVVAWGKNSDGQTNVPPDLTNVIAIAAGGNHSLGLQADGKVVAWGRNWDGQTNVPPAATNVIAIGAGAVHCVGLQADGSLLAWGGNDHRQTQLPNDTNKFSAIAAGYYHTLGLREDHKVIAWGSQTIVPSAVSNVVSIAAGWEHSLALRADGSVWAWGDDSYGQCRVPVAATNIVQIAAGYGYSMAQRADGKLLAWGAGIYGITNIPVALQNIAMVAAGEVHAFALVELGPARFEKLPRNATAHIGGSAVFDVAVRGTERLQGQWFHDGAPLLNATNRQLWLTQLQPADAGNYVFIISNSVSIASNSPVLLDVLPTPVIATEFRRLNHPPAFPLHLAATAYGAPPLHYQWQFDGVDLSDSGSFGGTQTPELTLNAPTFADSGDFSLVVSNAHGMVTNGVSQVLITPIIGWGDNAANQLQVPAGLTDVIAVSAGGEHSLALRLDGHVVAWGLNASGQTNVPSTVENAVAIAAGGTHSVALLADGRVFAWGDNTNGQCNVPVSATNMVAIAAGDSVTVALRSDGVALLWGKYNGFLNFSGGIATNGVAVSANKESGYALRADGTVQPAVDFLSNSNVVALAGGGAHLLALTADGQVFASGRNYYGQAEVPAAATNVLSVAAGAEHGVAQRADGSLIAWGANFSGQLDAPAEASNAVAISAGGAHNLALSRQAGLPLVGMQLTRSAMLGQSVFLVANPQSAGRAQYQWQLNGQDLVGATNSALILSGLNWSNAGNYQVIISNALGVTVGSPVALTVTRTPLVFETNGVFAPSYTNQFRARLLGAAGTGPVIIYASTNLVDWLPVYTNPPVVGAIDYTEPVLAGMAQRFYRAAEAAAPTPVQLGSPALDVSNQLIRLTMHGLTAAGPVTIYSSTNLVDWNAIHTNPPTVSPWEYVDLFHAERPMRFYRVAERW